VASEELTEESLIENAQDGLEFLKFAYETEVKDRQRINLGVQVVLGLVTVIVGYVARTLPTNNALIASLIFLVATFAAGVIVWIPFSCSFPGKAADHEQHWDRYVAPSRIEALAYRTLDFNNSINKQRLENSKAARAFRAMLGLGLISVALSMVAKAIQ